MKVEGSYTFAAPRDVVWPMLLDPEVLANVMPGCEELKEVGENQYVGVLKIKVGPVQGKFNGEVTLTDIAAPNSYNMVVDGKGPAGFVKGDGGLRLEEEGSTTIMHYSGDAQVGGRIASVGQRLLDTSAKAIIRQSLDGLNQQVEARMVALQAEKVVEEKEVEGKTAVSAPTPKPTTPTSPPPPLAPPTQTQFAMGVAKNFIEELIPEDQREDTISKAIMILGGLFLFRLITKWWTRRIAREVAKMLQK
ncbi:MAG: carbon monoxide dehydrogenase subunit G [Ardenticatenaceae bacterium]|nr:carbon monoxide dehydrogenase subunit G [Ardenticatenaceae bacterium]